MTDQLFTSGYYLTKIKQMNIKSKLLVLFSQYNLILDSLKLMLLSKRNKKPGDYKGLPV